MKKLPPFCLLGLSLVSAFGQGQVNFLNGGATFATVANRYVYETVVGPGAVDPRFPNFLGSADPNRLTGTTWVAGLWYLPGANRGGEIFSSAVQAGRLFNFRPSTTALQNQGTWLVPIGASSLFTLDGVNFGSTATLQVRVWDSALYATFESAWAAGDVGHSDAFNYTAPLQGELNPNAYLMDNLRTFRARVVPEPSLILLGLIGAASLALFRRKQ